MLNWGGVIGWMLLLCMFSVGSAWGQSNIEIWSEDWSGGSANDMPDKVNSSCSASNSGTKLFNEKLATGTAPELLLKSKDALVIAISDLKGCSGDLNFQFKSNNTNNTVSSSTAGVTVGALSTSNKVRSCKITVPQGTNSLVIIISNTTSKNTRLDDIVLSGIGVVTQTAFPVLSPKSGTSFADNLMVTASCATDGATIYYTADESDPTTASEVFPVSGLEITQTTTLKAIAVKDGLDNSEVVTATYTKLEPYTSLKALKESGIATAEGVTCFVELKDAVVTYADSRKAYIQDVTGGLYIYGNNDLKAGTKLNGVVSAQLALYNGLYELKVEGGEFDNVEVTEGVEIPVQVVTVAELNQNFARYESMRVKVVDATVTSGFNNKKGEIEQNGEKIALRAADESITADVQATVDVTGYPGLLHSDKQLNVILQEDIAVKTAGKTQATLAFEQGAYSVNLGESLIIKATTNSTSPIIYSSEDEEIAKVDSEGKVQAGNKAGTVMITASVAENDEFTGATATCTVNVVDPSALPEAKALVAEDKEGILHAMKNELGNTRLNAMEVYALNGKIIDEGKADIKWYVNIDNGTIQNTNGMYVVFEDANDSDIKLSSKKGNSWYYKSEDGSWNTKETNGRFLGYNEQITAFRTYSSSTYPKAVAMPIVDGYVRNVASGDYGTICLPYTVAAEDMVGADFFSVAGKVMKEGQPQSIVLEQVTTLEAGVPYIFSATSDKLIIAYSGKAVDVAGGANGLMGSFEGQDVSEGMYLLTNNTVKKVGSAGGHIGANRAYFNMDEMPEYIGTVGVNQRVISLDGVTAIDGVEAGNPKMVDVYTLSGIKVKSQVPFAEATQGLAKGIYVVNAKKVVVE